MSRKTFVFALTVLAIALVLVPGVYAYPIENVVVVQDLPDNMVAGNSYLMVIEFDNNAKESIDLTVEMVVTSADPIGPNEIFVDDMRLNGVSIAANLDVDGYFTTGGSVDASSHNELTITVRTVINLMPGAYEFSISLLGEEVTPGPSQGPSLGRPNKKPKANAGPDQTVYLYDTVYLSGSESYDPDGSIRSWNWDFGDGQKSTGITTSYIYPEPGEYTVTLTVKDWRNGEGSDTCIISVIERVTPPLPTPAEFELSNLEITPTETEPGEEVSITFDVTNVGEEEGVCTVTLNVEGWATTFVVTLDGGKSEKLEHHVSPEAEGTYQVEVEELSDSFTVTSPPIPLKPAEFIISDLTVSPTEVSIEEEVTVSVLVTNVGEETGECVVVLKTTLGDDSWEVSNIHMVDGGESETSEFILTPNVEGIYNVEINELLGSFTVTVPEGFVLSPGYISGILVLIIIAGTTTYTLYRRGRLS